MSDLVKHIKTLSKEYNTSQTKYTYYLLSISASCIAFILYHTRESTLSCSQIPLGLAAFSWLTSFYFGCKKITSNLLIKEECKKYIQNKDVIENDSKKKKSIMQITEEEIQNGKRYLRYQFTFIVIGAAFFVTWHILEMIKRTHF